MTSLIDNYSTDPTTLFSNLSIEQNMTEHKTSLNRNSIFSHSSHLNVCQYYLAEQQRQESSSQYIQEEQKKQQKVLLFLIQKLYLGYQIFIQIRIRQKSKQIIFKAKVLQNGVPIQALFADQRIWLNRYFLRLNRLLQFACSQIDLVSGHIIFRISLFYSTSQFERLNSDYVGWILTQQIQIITQCIQMHIYKILMLLNKITKQQYQDILKKTRSKNISKQVGEYQNLIYKLLPFIDIQDYALLIKNNHSQIQDRKKNSQEIEFMQIIKMYTTHQTKKLLLSRQELRQFQDVLRQPIVKYLNNQSSYIYCEIAIIRNGVWQQVCQGGFAIIEKSFIDFKEKHKDQLYRKVLIRKRQKDNKNRVKHQKQILSTLKNQVSPFIAKFYEVKDLGHQNAIYAQYYPQGSMQVLINKSQQFLTLSTKLFILKNIAFGILFLYTNKITHRDLKPNNIMIDKLMTKIIDFGQSYHQNCADHKPGFSRFYSAPEIYNPESKKFSHKTDIFSYCVLAFEFIFGQYPIRQSTKDYGQKFRSNPFKCLMNQVYEKSNMYIYSPIFLIMLHLFIKGLDINQSSRASINNIVLAIQCCIVMDEFLHD